jgi:hypothetical protein
MGDDRTEQDDRQAGKSGKDREARSDDHRSKTAGTNRDFDETGESANQGHGHPREERGD